MRNCQSHLEVKAFMPLRGFAAEAIKDAAFEVQLRTRKQRATQTSPGLLPMADVQRPVFFEIK